MCDGQEKYIKDFVGCTSRKGSLEKPRRRWEDNTKVDFKDNE